VKVEKEEVDRGLRIQEDKAVPLIEVDGNGKPVLDLQIVVIAVELLVMKTLKEGMISL